MCGRAGWAAVHVVAPHEFTKSKTTLPSPRCPQPNDPSALDPLRYPSSMKGSTDHSPQTFLYFRCGPVRLAAGMPFFVMMRNTSRSRPEANPTSCRQGRYTVVPVESTTTSVNLKGIDNRGEEANRFGWLWRID